jgi:hypothetical protein
VLNTVACLAGHAIRQAGNAFAGLSSGQEISAGSDNATYVQRP